MANVSNSNLYFDAGIPNLQDACIVIVKTEWNKEIVDKLEEGCLRLLYSYKISNIKVITVPGAFEIPFTIKNYWSTNKENGRIMPDAFIALGCIVRGGTPHFEYVSQAATQGILQLNLTLPVPTIFGILTLDNLQQAHERIGGIHGHKGEEAALTALKMISLKSST